jgi:vacuolar-type H+-ATPase subunit C/Vma6
MVLAAKYMKLEPSLVRKRVIDLKYRLRETAVSKLISSDVQEAPMVPLWPSYSNLVSRAVELIGEGKIVEMQSLFSKYLYSYAERMSVRNPNSLVYVFSYLQLCVREARNLTALAIGKQTKLSEEKLGGLLFL